MMVRTACSTSTLLGLWISDRDALARSSACTFGFIEMPFHVAKDDCQGSLNPLDVALAERFPMAGGPATSAAAMCAEGSAYRAGAGMVSRLAGGPPERIAVIRWTPCFP